MDGGGGFGVVRDGLMGWGDVVDIGRRRGEVGKIGFEMGELD